MSVDYTPDAKGARMGAVKAMTETGSGTAQVRIYTAPRPATGAAPSGATQLIAISLPAVCGAVVDDELVLDVPEESTVIADGTPSWARLVARDGTVVCDMPAGLPGSGMDVEIAVPTLYTGSVLKNTSAVIRHA